MWSEYYFDKGLSPTEVLGKDFPLLRDALQWSGRARTLLDRLNPNQVTTVIELVNWLHSEPEDLEGSGEQATYFPDIADDTMDSTATAPNVVVLDLLALQEKYDLSSYDCGFLVNWSDVFAVIGLNQIALASLSDQRYVQGWMDDGYEGKFHRLGWASHSISPAIEIIPFAEMERVKEDHTENIQQEVEQKISLRGREARAARTAKTTVVKNAFIDWYSDNFGKDVFKTYEHAADIFYDQLPPSKKKLLKPTRTGYQQTLLRALKKHRRLLPSN